MKNPLDHFQKIKEEFIQNGWLLISETPYKVELKEDEDAEENKFLSFLQTETLEFLKNEPAIETGVMTHFGNGESGDRTVEIVWKFCMRGYWYSLSAYFDPMLKDHQVETHLISTWDKPNLLATLGMQEKDELNRIYAEFKRIIKEMPRYRLYFATRDIAFHEARVLQWL